MSILGIIYHIGLISILIMTITTMSTKLFKNISLDQIESEFWLGLILSIIWPIIFTIWLIHFYNEQTTEVSEPEYITP